MSKMPTGKSNKFTPTKARVTFSDKSLWNTATGTDNSSNTKTTPSTSALDTADDLLLTDTINRIFNRKLLAMFTGKDAILMEVRNCVIRNDGERLKNISLFLYSYWRDMSVKHGCFCIDERVAIPKAIMDAILEDIHSTHPGNFAMLLLAHNIRWPYIHRDLLAKASECKACKQIVKNLKLVIPHSEWSPLPNCIEPNDEIQIEFGGPIIIEKIIEQNFIANLDRYTK